MQSPILLVEIDQAGKCTLNEEALSLLKGIEDEICVVAVAGLYRTGKSYLLNRLMGTQHGFEIGPTVNACTKGIWLWGSPISYQNKKILLIDTEGLGSTERDQTIDMIIFSISVLISSTFVYNSIGNIDEQALEDLSLVCKLTQHIHVKSSQGASNGDVYSQYFPKFIWALRDFCLQLVDNEGKQISPGQYLENCLVPAAENSEESKAKNEVRRILKAFFKERECFTFVRPINSDKKLRNIQNVPFEELRDEFKNQVSWFVEQVLSNAKVKMVDGVAVSGKSLGLLLEVYVEAINRDAVPNISTAWERTVDAQIKEAYRTANNTYKKLVKELRNEMPKEDTELRAMENEARKAGLKILDKVPTISGLKEETIKIRCKYIDRCDSSLETLILQNFQSSRSKSATFLRTLFESLEDKLITTEKYHWLPDEFSSIFDKVSSTPLGPAAFHCLSESYSKDGARIIMKLISQLNRLHKQEVKSLQSELDAEREKFLKNFKDLEDINKNNINKLDQERRNFKEQKKFWDSNLEDARMAISGNSQEFNSIQKKLREENLELSKQIAELVKRPPVIQTDLTGVREIMEKLSKKNEDLSIEKALSDCKLEYEMKISSNSQSDLEKNTQRQLFEAKKMSDSTLIQLKKSYEKEIKELKSEITLFELKMKDFTAEILKRDMQIKVLNEKFRGRETEKKIRTEQGELIVSVSELLIKFLRKLETGKGGDLKEELSQVQGKVYLERVSRMSRI